MKTRSVATYCAALALVAASCANGTDATEGDSVENLRPTQSGTMMPPLEVHEFTTIEDMVATSRAVVRGHVVSVAPGRKVGDEIDWIQFEETTIAVDEVLAGEMPTPTFVLESAGWDMRGNRLQFSNGPRANRMADDGIYFVWLKRDATAEPRYRLTNSQGRFLRGADGVATGSRAFDPLVSQLAGRNFDDLRARVVAARGGRPLPEAVPFAN